ncbi:Spo12 family [Emericellopsis cladophorae]|uniref:Spo12 family n=1 Tax=Emericellopsis cladophorae TaxID=2686198 RepID=A0A9P9Y7R1_9HYPO|nr:Spo12 family [Emericellopsis cladophorae]KAI6785079.1 Spo12 family [Emericellopsis cladophorae]
MSSTVLGERDINAPMEVQPTVAGKDVKNMEYHRQMFQSKMAEPSQQYVSPSDNIMSPCSSKINALRNKHIAKAKPRSLFAQASKKRLQSDGSALGAPPSKP